MALHKYLDWRGWFEGLYLSWIKTVTTSAMTYLGTNAVDSLGAHGIAINLKQAGTMLAIITIMEILKYLNQKPKPEEKEETI